MKWIAVAGLACLATPAFAVNLETDAGVLIGGACAEIWDAKTMDKLNGLSSTILDQYGVVIAEVSEALARTKDEYELARRNYVAAYNTLTDSMTSLAIKSGDLALKTLLEQRSHSPESRTLDALVEQAVNAGDTVVQGTDVAVADTANTELVAAQQEAEQELLRSGKAYLHEVGRHEALNQVLNAIFVCLADQQAYINGGEPPKRD